MKFFDTVCTSIHSKWVTNGINLPWSWGYLGTMSCKAELRSKVNQSSPHATFGYHLKLPKKTRRGKVTKDQIGVDHTSMIASSRCTPVITESFLPWLSFQTKKRSKGWSTLKEDRNEGESASYLHEWMSSLSLSFLGYLSKPKSK